MFKKFLASLAAVVLAVTTIGGAALAADANEVKEGDVIAVTALENLQQGTYELDAELSCYLTAMGGVEFGEPLLTKTTLEVDKEGKAMMTLEFGTGSVNIYGINANTYVAEKYFYSGDKDAYFGIKNGETWSQATYTVSEEASVKGNSSAGKVDSKYVTSMTVPVSAVTDAYNLALAINSDVMGMQFGGPDATYTSTLTVDWANTKILDLIPENAISVSNFAELQPGTYKLDAELSCYLTAMGGVEFGAPLLKSATLEVGTDKSVTMTLEFDTGSVNIYGINANTYVAEKYFYSGDKDAYFGIKNGETWSQATYTVSEEASVKGNSSAGKVDSKYVTSMTVPVSAVTDTYNLALAINSDVMGMQFGGPDATYEATLTIDWNKTQIIELVKVEVTNNTNNTSNTNNTNNTTTEASPKTGDTAVFMPMLGLVATSTLVLVAVYMKKERHIKER